MNIREKEKEEMTKKGIEFKNKDGSIKEIFVEEDTLSLLTVITNAYEDLSNTFEKGLMPVDSVLLDLNFNSEDIELGIQGLEKFFSPKYPNDFEKIRLSPESYTALNYFGFDLYKVVTEFNRLLWEYVSHGYKATSYFNMECDCSLNCANVKYYTCTKLELVNALELLKKKENILCEDHNLFKFVVRSKCKEIAIWCLNNIKIDFDLLYKNIEVGILQGNPDIAELIINYLDLDFHRPKSVHIAEAAARKGYYGLLRKIIERGCECGPSVLYIAINNNDCEILDYLKGKNTEELPPDTYTAAAINGNIKILQWLKYDCKCRQWSGDGEIPKDCDACFFAVENRHKDCLEWLNSNGFPLTTRLFEAAIENNDLDILSFLISHNCPRDKDALSVAIRHGNMEIMELLRKNNFEWGTKAWRVACEKNNLETLVWLKANACPMQDIHFAEIIYRGNFEILVWLKENGFNMEQLKKEPLWYDSIWDIKPRGDVKSQFKSLLWVLDEGIYVESNFCIRDLRDWVRDNPERFEQIENEFTEIALKKRKLT